jgi:hypothetical protein
LPHLTLFWWELFQQGSKPLQLLVLTHGLVQTGLSLFLLFALALVELLLIGVLRELLAAVVGLWLISTTMQ